MFGRASKIICTLAENCGEFGLEGAVGPSARGSALRRGETGAMGERLAGATIRDWRPNGLIARLAALEGRFAGVAGNGGEPWPARLPLLPFALGLSASLLVGAAAAWLLGVTPAVGAAEHTAGSAWRAAAAAPRQRPGPLEIEVVRGDQPSAFPLLVTGLEDVADARVVLRNLPEALWFSRGERRDEHTWELARADLDELAVTLRAGTPQAFALDIEVVAADAAPLAHGVAAVHVLGVPSEAGNAPAPRPAQKLAAAPAGAGMSAPKGDVVQFKRHTGASPPQLVTREAKVRTAVAAPEPARPQAEDPGWRTTAAAFAPVQRPAGMSALGALSREPAPEGRWLWWRLPVLAWPNLAEAEGARR